ncbi:MAG: protein kinase domain-containing protein [Myxococcota bacterium]
MVLSTGDIVDDRYEVERIIEVGEFGCVANVEHVHLGQPFTLKLVDASYDRDSAPVKRLREEARANSLVQHENAIFVTDIGRCAEFGHYLVTERHRGEHLSNILVRDEKLPVEDVVRIARDAGNAVSSAHQIGVIHKGLHPDNLLVDLGETAGWVCKVIEFGVAEPVIDARSPLGVSYADYRAPELHLGANEDARSDQFSLGMLVYRMLTGQKPEQSEIDEDDVRSPSTFEPTVPPRMDAAIVRAIRRAPEERFDTVEAFIDAVLESWHRGLEPRTDPMDETSQVTPDSPPTQGGMGLFAPTEPMSLVISVEEDESVPSSGEKRLTLTFQNHERLRREYRRNIVAGGIFVPTTRSFALHESLRLDVSLVDEESVSVRAEVVDLQDGAAGRRAGVGLMLDTPAIEALEVYLRERAGLDLEPDDILIAHASAEDGADVSRAGAYLISRLSYPRTVADLRREAAGLPFDLEQELAALVEMGLVAVEAADSEPSQVDELGIATEAPTEARVEGRGAAGAIVDFDQRDPWRLSMGRGLEESSRIDYTDNEVDRVMSLVDYQVRRQNYLAALRTLQKAIVVSPAAVDFHHRLARLHMQFTGDHRSAMEALQDALQIAPDREDVRETLRKLKNLRSG